MKEEKWTEAMRAFDEKMKTLLENDREGIFKNITKDTKRNPSRMPAFELQTEPDMVLRVHIGLPSAFRFGWVDAELWYMDRDNDRFPGILMCRSEGEGIEDAVESLFNWWNKRKADELLHDIQDLFWHISEDNANQYEINKDITNGDWYRKPLFVKCKDDQYGESTVEEGSADVEPSKP